VLVGALAIFVAGCSDESSNQHHRARGNQHAGLRPGEALGLRWADLGVNTLLIERAISLGEEGDTKTRRHRAVRLLSPLKRDLAEWRLASGRPSETALVFPGVDGTPWTLAAYQSWRRRAFRRATSWKTPRACPRRMRFGPRGSEWYPLGTRKRSAGAIAADERIPESRIAMRDPREWS
jgi:integrase